MSNIAIRVENLGKSYLIGHERSKNYVALRDVFANKTKQIVDKSIQFFRGGQLLAGDEIEEFWALKDINLEIKQGDRLGIIGVNGAGKSTILKILSRITEPSEGKVSIKGRVASLLEVGTGFHPELTGRENIYLNGAILGMKRVEIKKKFDEIVAFAETERFLDTPVKRYSSGMYVRLAFAVAANLEPDILIVDEVLAVGDIRFQKKCLGKMDEIAKNEGRTIIFVSHNMLAIKQLCDKAMLLHNGKLSSIGDSETIVNNYLQTTAHNYESSLVEIIDRLPLCKSFKLKSIKLSQNGEQPTRFINSEDIEIEIDYQVFIEKARLYVEFEILDSEGNCLTESCHNSDQSRPVTSPGIYKSRAVIPRNTLAPIYHELKFFFGAFGDENFYPPIQFAINLFSDGETNMMYLARPLGGRIILPIQWSINRMG